MYKMGEVFQTTVFLDKEELDEPNWATFRLILAICQQLNIFVQHPCLSVLQVRTMCALFSIFFPFTLKTNNHNIQYLYDKD